MSFSLAICKGDSRYYYHTSDISDIDGEFPEVFTMKNLREHKWWIQHLVRQIDTAMSKFLQKRCSLSVPIEDHPDPIPACPHIFGVICCFATETQYMV